MTSASSITPSNPPPSKEPGPLLSYIDASGKRYGVRVIREYLSGSLKGTMVPLLTTQEDLYKFTPVLKVVQDQLVSMPGQGAKITLKIDSSPEIKLTHSSTVGEKPNIRTLSLSEAISKPISDCFRRIIAENHFAVSPPSRLQKAPSKDSRPPRDASNPPAEVGEASPPPVPHPSGPVSTPLSLVAKPSMTPEVAPAEEVGIDSDFQGGDPDQTSVPVRLPATSPQTPTLPTEVTEAPTLTSDGSNPPTSPSAAGTAHLLDNQNPAEDSEGTHQDVLHIESLQTLTSTQRRNRLSKWLPRSSAREKSQKYHLSLDESLRQFRSSDVSLEGLQNSYSDTSLDGIYQNELKAFIKRRTTWGKFTNLFYTSKEKDFHISLYCALKVLESPESYDNDPRLQYKDFIRHLRNTLDSESYKTFCRNHLVNPHPENKKLIQCLQSICAAKFTSTYLFNYWEALLKELCGKPPSILDFGTLAKTLQENNKTLSKSDPNFRQHPMALAWKKLKGTLGIGFDSVGNSNVPNVRSQQTFSVISPAKNGNPEETKLRTVTRLSHGTPTIEGGILSKISYLFRKIFYPLLDPSTNARIAPEYLEFLRSLKAKGKKILYVNHQKTSGWESDRSDVLYKLQNDPEFKDMFHCMSLPMDGEYFNSLIQGQGQSTTEDFKKKLIGLFFNEDAQPVANSPALLPKALVNNTSLHEKIQAIYEAVNQNYFDGQALVTLEDRRDFVFLFYSELTDYIMNAPEIQADFVAQVCKDGKDRGRAKNGIDEAKYILMTCLDEESRNQALQDLYVNTLGAYTIKWEEIVPGRLVYLTSILERFSKLTDEQINKIRAQTLSTNKVIDHESVRIKDLNPEEAVPSEGDTLVRNMLKKYRDKPLKDIPLENWHAKEVQFFGRLTELKNRKTLVTQIEFDVARGQYLYDGKLVQTGEALFALLGLGTIETYLSEDCNPSMEQLEKLQLLTVCHQGTLSQPVESLTLDLTSISGKSMGIGNQPESKVLSLCKPFFRSIPKKTIEELKAILNFVLGNAVSEGINRDYASLTGNPPDSEAFEELRKICEDSKNRKKFLDLVYRAMEIGYLPDERAHLFKANYTPTTEEPLSAISFSINSRTNTILGTSYLEVVDGQSESGVAAVLTSTKIVVNPNPEESITTCSREVTEIFKSPHHRKTSPPIIIQSSPRIPPG